MHKVSNEECVHNRSLWLLQDYQDGFFLSFSVETKLTVKHRLTLSIVLSNIHSGTHLKK